MNVRFRPEVADDLQEAFRWYEQRQQGLGRSFALEAEACFERIGEHPRACAALDEKDLEAAIRRASLRRFPYSALFFVTDDDHVIIVAVTHQARRPKFWKRRI